ncbi:cytochrome B6 [Sulfobacillus harzensis]|uniref:Cytochrome B6 n=1 Tax=Sulfobacillus harzensis TaxID=2729629 RepID=A0A7Y0Q4T0_9FIRM|nr:cytochrome B6 [Sulfobacillus harzensis]NMP24932.1 cytochrome B6 [Sulfobacillus harzensis]
MRHYHPRIDVTHRYRYVPADFVKHLLGTTLVVAVLAVVLSGLFHEPVRPALKINTYATTHPKEFLTVALGDLNGTGEIANYGPPYNNGTGSVQDVVQTWVGVIHPVYPREDFVLKPLAYAAHLDPSLTPALRQFTHASAAQQAQWEEAFATALQHARVQGPRVLVPAGAYGPLNTMMQGILRLGQSGLMTGALDRSPADYQFDNQNSLLFLQGRPLHNAAKKLELEGNQWGIIHEERAPYPGPWWMTIVTAIYQLPFIANASAADALALGSGMVVFLVLMLAPWIPGINRLPRLLGVHRLIWRKYYAKRQSAPVDLSRSS